MQIKDSHIKTNNLNVSCNDAGSSETSVIVFIHGFPFNKSMWDNQMEALNENYRVIAYDIRGHGNTITIKQDDFSIDLFVEDLVSLLDTLKLNKVILCGLSMGGYIALSAVEKYPERFDGLVLCDTQCIADTPEAKEKRMKTIETIKKNGVENYADESIKNFFAAESFSTKQKEIAAIREIIVDTTEESLCNTLIALSKRKETCSKLENIKVPVLILVGKEDKITPPAAALFMHEKIKDSTLSIIENAGHLSNMENPIEFNNQLKKFMQQFVKKGSSVNI